MIVETLKESILAHIGRLRPGANNWLRRNCPMCHTQGHGRDTRMRFGIQFGPRDVAMNCFNCGFSAGYTEGKPLGRSLKHFLKTIGVDHKFVEKLDFEIFRLSQTSHENSADAVGAAISRAREGTETWNTTPLPATALTIAQWIQYQNTDPDFLNVLEYMISRRITAFDEFYWSPDREGHLNQRLIIPFTYNDRSTGYVARLFYTTPDKSIPKYLQVSPKSFVYNLDPQMDWRRRYVIVTEGVLDAWSVDGASMLGEVTPSKVDTINRLGKTVIVSPDLDQKGGDLVQVALENKWSVAFPPWEPGIKDASQAAEKYGRPLTTLSIIQNAVSKPDKIRLRWQIAQNERKKHKNGK